MRMPIMGSLCPGSLCPGSLCPGSLCPETREKYRFGHKTIMSGWPGQVQSGDLPMSAPLQIGLVIFPHVTQLDFTGPLQVFSRVPGAKVHLIWKRIEPVASDTVLTLTPTITFSD